MTSEEQQVMPKVRIETINGRHKQGTPFLAAAWLVENYGEHADAQGISGPTAAVEETYANIALLLAEPAS